MEKKDRMTRVMSSEYMLWAKTQQAARYNLAVSGMPSISISELPVKLDDLEISRAGVSPSRPNR